MMSSLLEPDDFEGTSDSCCISDEALDNSSSLPDHDSELFAGKTQLKNTPPSPESADSPLDANCNTVVEDAMNDTGVLLVDAGEVSPGSDCVILKMDGRDSESKAVCLTGKMMQLVDGTFAFVEHSNNGENDIYTPIKLYNGSVLYVLTNTLLGAMNDTKPLAETTVKRDKNKGFACAYSNCVKSYASLHHLKVHMRAHTGVRPFKCPQSQCGKAFSTGFGLKTHIRTHNGERPYNCPHKGCEKSFKTSGDLSKHIRIHTGERPFMCPIPDCGRTFTTCNICKVHVRTHTGERPYSCTYAGCDKTFASVTNQRNHLRIHSGEKPYQCHVPDCGRRFTEYSSLYKHTQVHRMPRYICEHCSAIFKTAQALTVHVTSAHKDSTSLDTASEYVK